MEVLEGKGTKEYTCMSYVTVKRRDEGGKNGYERWKEERHIVRHYIREDGADITTREDGEMGQKRLVCRSKEEAKG